MYFFEEYINIVAFGVYAVILSVILFIFSKLVAPNKKNIEKSAPYECGFEPFGDARSKFNVHFYLVSILFMIFDLELVFIFPWAVNIFLATTLSFVIVFFF